jgi:hypothetical protein
MSQPNSYKGNELIAQPAFVRDISVASDDFYAYDRADVKATFPTVLDPDGANQFYDGFLVKPITNDGDIDVITWEDFQTLKSRGRLSEIDNYTQTLHDNTAGVWNETKVIKVFTSSTVTDIQIGV